MENIAQFLFSCELASSFEVPFKILPKERSAKHGQTRSPCGWMADHYTCSFVPTLRFPLSQDIKVLQM